MHKLEYCAVPWHVHLNSFRRSSQDALVHDAKFPVEDLVCSSPQNNDHLLGMDVVQAAVNDGRVRNVVEHGELD